MTDIILFAETVQKMRIVQNEYFRTKAPHAMARAKKLEKEVDDMVKVIVVPAPNIQKPLF